MNAKQLKNSILQEAICGRLVPQDPNDEPASVLLERIRAEKQRLVKEGKLKKKDLIETPISDDEKPFEIPDSWEWVRLGIITTVLGGKRIPAGRKLSQKNTGYVYIRVSDMKDDTVSLDNLQYVPNDIFPFISRYIINKEDVFITVAGTIGRVGKIPPELDGANLTENADRLVFSIIDQDWLIKCLQSPFIQTQISDVTTKVGQPKLAILRIQNLFIPLPPLAEQKRIVAKIEELMPKVEEYGKAQEALDKLSAELPERLKKSILQEAIEGRLVPQDPNDEPASVLLERIRSEKQHLVKEGKLKKKDLVETPISDDEKPFDIPDSWEWCKIGELFAHNNGKQLNKGNSSGRLMDYITTSNLYWDGFRLDNLKQMPYEESEIERCQAIKGDLLVCEGGDVGRSCIWPYDYPIMLQNHIHKLRAYFPLCTKYFYYILYNYNLSGVIGGKGIGIQGFSSRALHNTVIPLPPLAEQKRIVAKIEELFKHL